MIVNLAVLSLFIQTVTSTLLSDSGCSCALTKTATTTPSANTTIAAGCLVRPDWTGQLSTWCLTDQSAGLCGTFQTGFGYADSCGLAGVPSVQIQPPVLLEPDQGNLTFYTGQTLTVNWTTQNLLSDEWLKISYQGVGTRTLTTGSGVNNTAKSFAVRISDSANSLTTNVPLLISTVSSPSIGNVSSQNLTILQSKIAYVYTYDGQRLLTTGTSVVCDNRNITVIWRGLGEAGVGLGSVTIRQSGGGGGGGATVGTAVTSIVARGGNMTINYICPSTTTIPGFGNSFSAQISIQSPGTGVTPYTLNSNSFSLAAAPSSTPSATPSVTSGLSPTKTPTTTSTPTPTPTQTPTASLSTGSTASNTPTISVTSSITPSVTPTISMSSSYTPSASVTASSTPTPSTTETARPSIDLSSVNAAAQAASMQSVGIILGSVFGSILFVILAGFAYRSYQYAEIRKRRLQRQAYINQNLADRSRVYGITVDRIDQSNIVYSAPFPSVGRGPAARQGSGRGFRR